MRFFDKIKWVASILLVFFIVLITNIIDRDNFNRLSYSVTTLYEDRIVVSDILFEMAMLTKEKQIALLTSDTAFFKTKNNHHAEALDLLMERYGRTKLTETERRVFSQLQEELKSLKVKEQSPNDLFDGEALKSLENINLYLQDLSKIQLQEAKRQVFVSDRAKDTINFFTQAEIIFLIIMAVLVQVILLYKTKK